jgi:hypothetical protein
MATEDTRHHHKVKPKIVVGNRIVKSGFSPIEILCRKRDIVPSCISMVKISLIMFQLIWRGSRYFGVGKAFSSDMCIVVAYYFPPGNIVEEFNENVGTLEDNIDGVVVNETMKPAGIMAEYGQYGE